ncbi:hypothetical protein N0725_05025 [Pseudomonas aeruginosa]|uniref:hypothetical protein n=1 Tax=Pseudomonas aeruginosa TaxID=287 RepID=UPI0004F27C9B|nr:hypothetical protein [Pseudomonas aeruginosa]ELK3486142.1 hypothetical protein [Pseudomonas aeruginosa]ELK3488816.1 hypothetical protein [Pseudomonas aeruginosa]EME9750197.1 hypothetical protein [Pseudomonas aeruginosa]MBG4583254.1 hypothetical protein [Pseudomonas aeruginosa]MBH9070820.1 hypothetical protein [Pseudomonas aeruginosa]
MKLMIVTAMAVLVANLASGWKGRNSILWGVLTACFGALYTPLTLLMVLVIACMPKVKAAPTDNLGTPQD